MTGEPVTIYQIDGWWNKLEVFPVEGVRTAKQIRTPASITSGGDSYEVTDPAKALYTREEAYARIQAAIDERRKRAEWEMAAANTWQRQLDEMKAGEEQ